jgi:uncharacterized spore protein YtfJ
VVTKVRGGAGGGAGSGATTSPSGGLMAAVTEVRVRVLSCRMGLRR